MDLASLPPTLQEAVTVRLAFAPWFVPNERGQGSDVRQLVVRAPSELVLLPRARP